MSEDQSPIMNSDDEWIEWAADEIIAKDARISSLEQRVKELEEALKEATDIIYYTPVLAISKAVAKERGEDEAVEYAELIEKHHPKAIEFLARAREVLCHADASRAESPHRAVGALQSDDGEAR